MSGTPAAFGGSFKAACLLLLCICAPLLLPRLGANELRVEEGRRAWAARGMLEKGDYLVPRIFGRPYLSKPPLHPWTVALLSAPAGEVTPRSTRLAAALPSLALALALLAFAWRRLGPRPALCAALLLAAAPQFVEKGRLGEIEALLSLCCFLAVAGLGLAVEARRMLPFALAAGLALGAGLLAKGPPALVFFLAAAGAAAWLAPERRARLLRAALLALGVGLSLALAWAAALVSALPQASAVGLWAGELVGQGERGLWGYLRERPEYALATILGMAPASLVVLGSLRRGLLARLRADPTLGLALAATLPAWIWFLLYPGTAARYVFPILPWVALLAAGRLEALWTVEQGSPAALRVRRILRVWAALAALAAALGLAASLGALRPLGLDPLGLGELRLPPSAAVLAGLALLFAVLALVALGHAARAPKGTLWLLLALVAVLAFEQQASGLRRSRRHQAHLAERLEAELPPGETLHVALWQEFNLLFLLRRELVHLDDPRAIPPGGYVLLRQDAARALLESSPDSFASPFTLEGPRSGPLVLLRAAASGSR